MFIAVIDRAGLIHFIEPLSIRSVTPSGHGSHIAMQDGRTFESPDSADTIQRRVRALTALTPGRMRILMRLRAADLWRRARRGLCVARRSEVR